MSWTPVETSSHTYTFIFCAKVEVVYLHQQNLLRSIKDWEFEIDELKNFISNLNQELNINKFHRIPEKEARIHELEGFIEKAIKELAKTDSKIGYCDFL